MSAGAQAAGRSIGGASALERLAAALTCLALALMLCLSSMALARFGWRYEVPGGLPFEKVHPATLCALLALAALALARGPALLGEVILRAPLILAYAFGWALLLAYSTLILTVPFTGLIDAYLLPAVLFVLLVVGGVRTSPAVPVGLHLCFAANAALGLLEFVTGGRLNPYVAGGVAITGDWRSTALLGHPLMNSCLVGAYVVILATGGVRGLAPGWRVPAIGLQLMALVVFGGRAALVLTLAIVALQTALVALQVLAGRRIGVARAALVALALPVAALALAALAEAGFFDLLLERFVSDKGSAQARVAMFELFAWLRPGDVLFGPDPEFIAALQQREGLEYGIESFWLASVLTYGLLVSLVLFAALFALAGEIVRAAGAAALVPLVYFFAVASTFVSLAGKSCLLAVFVTLTVTLYRNRSAG